MTSEEFIHEVVQHSYPYYPNMDAPQELHDWVRDNRKSIALVWAGNHPDFGWFVQIPLVDGDSFMWFETKMGWDVGHSVVRGLEDE